MRAAPIALLLLSACSIPQLDLPNAAAIDRAAFPQLVPLARIADRAAAQTVQITPAVTAGVQAQATGLQHRASAQPSAIAPAAARSLRDRATSLQRRAAMMRQSALNDADRERLRAALLRLRERTGPV